MHAGAGLGELLKLTSIPKGTSVGSDGFLDHFANARCSGDWLRLFDLDVPLSSLHPAPSSSWHVDERGA